MQLLLKISGLVSIYIVLCVASGRPDSLVENIHLPEKLYFCEEPIELTQDVKERFEKEMLLTLWDRPQVILWLKRSPRYLPLIEEQLRIHQMPADLKYLAIAESALRPHAGSAKGAIGYWQLLPQTARKYGLTVSEFVDERREIGASTQAAIKYLQTLQQQFRSWTLAVAAYNMGEEGLAAEILEQKTTDYFKLYLPIETQRFIFRILAVKLIMENPERFGFIVNTEDQYPPVKADRIELNCFQEAPIRLIAEAADTYFKQIKELNPQLRGHYIQEGHYQIYLPEGSSEGFLERFSKLVSRYNEVLTQRIYIVQSGDSLSTIATKFDVPLNALLIWNRLDLNRPIHPGDRLVIHPPSGEND